MSRRRRRKRRKTLKGKWQKKWMWKFKTYSFYCNFLGYCPERRTPRHYDWPVCTADYRCNQKELISKENLMPLEPDEGIIRLRSR